VIAYLAISDIQSQINHEWRKSGPVWTRKQIRITLWTTLIC
jgi:hypothetical protein